MKTSLFIENLKVSIQSIKTNKLRAILTIFIIAFGIMALVGILTAIDSIKNSITKQFTMLGANSFTIESRGMHIQVGDKRYRKKNHHYISYQEALRFKDEFKFPGVVSISTRASGIATVKHKSEKTNPNIRVLGADENYLRVSGKELLKGRNFSLQEIETNRNFAIVGSGIVNTLFNDFENPLNKVISVGGGKYKIIGVLKDPGSSFMGDDRLCILPVTNVRQYFSRPRMSFNINVLPNDPKLLDVLVSEAEGVFRVVRGLTARDESDFNINKSDNLVNVLIESMGKVSLAASVIGLITLLGATIGLMNIMLVSVTERTREIGIRKAIGAKAQMIKQQFLFEAILIGQMGGAVGIVLGLLVGNLMSALLKSSFVVPWKWIISGVIACFIVGIVSGYLPAVKASKLDPIKALHHE
ncbi:MAG: ABC transporter permease [Bacteroidetes bacterium]|nr:ABC transporter permease [Bacteroidota bacterium]